MDAGQACSFLVWGFIFHLQLLPRAQMCFLLLVSSLPEEELLPSSLHWIGLPAVFSCFSLNIFSCFTPCLLLVCASSLVGFISPVMLSQHQLCIKREKMENFWTGTCALRERGSCEAGRVPMHWEAPSQRGPRGKCIISESQAKQGLKRADNRESCTSQSINSSQTVAPTRWQSWGMKRSTQKPVVQRVGLGC